MNTENPICVHDIYLSDCMTCNIWLNVGLDPKEMVGYHYNETLYGKSNIGYDPEQNKISEINAINTINVTNDAVNTINDMMDMINNPASAVKKQFLSLSIEQKRQVLKDICMYCLEESRGPCYCERDD